MVLAIIDQNDFETVSTLRSGRLVQDRRDGTRAVLKPAAAFVDPAVAEFLAQAWHPGIPRCLGQTVADTGDTLFVFEYIEGLPLTALIESHPEGIEATRWLPWMTQWAQILAYLHLQGEYPLAHLDVKPANLIVDRQGRAGLIDFDAARILDSRSSPAARDGKKALTASYAAPELVAGQPCPGSDLFALGLVMLVLLTGKKPEEWRDQPLSDTLSGQSVELQTLIGQCLHTEPGLRCSRADELVCDLKMISGQLQTGQKVKADQPDLPVNKVKTDRSDQPAEPDDPENPDHPDQHGPAKQPVQAESATEAKAGKTGGQPLPAPLICIWGGAACGCELAAVWAEKRSVLVIDADLLNPRADLLLGQPAWVWRDPSAVRLYGLDLAMQAEQQGRLTPQLLSTLARETAVPRVRLLECGSHLDDYEYCHVDSLHQILKWSRLIADLIIVLCSRSVFDAFTCLCLSTADQVIIPLTGAIGAFREVNRSLEFVSDRYHLEQNRLFFVAFPYDSQTDLSRGTMNELSDGRLAGVVSEHRQRRLCACGSKPYATGLSEINKKEYRQITGHLALIRQTVKGGKHAGCPITCLAV